LRAHRKSPAARLAQEVEAYTQAQAAQQRYDFPIHDNLSKDWLGQALCLWGQGPATAVFAAVRDILALFISCQQPEGLVVQLQHLLPLLDQLDARCCGRWQRLLEFPNLREALPLLLHDDRVNIYHPGIAGTSGLQSAVSIWLQNCVTAGQCRWWGCWGATQWVAGVCLCLQWTCRELLKAALQAYYSLKET
jgi:hypothetical protein